MFRTINGKELYRIGDCIISVNAENPSKNFGGTWQLLCPGRTLVCVDTNDGDFNSLKKTGGSKSVTLTTSQIPSHTHSQNAHSHNAYSDGAGSHQHYEFRNGAPTTSDLNTSQPPGTWATSTYTDQPYSMRSNARGEANVGLSSINGWHSHGIGVYNATATNNATGGSGSHTNLQPFMAVYIWVRVA